MALTKSYQSFIKRVVDNLSKDIFEKMHDEENYYRDNKPIRYDEQFENMKDFDETIDKLKKESALKYIDPTYMIRSVPANA
jgi:hypothetical protein